MANALGDRTARILAGRNIWDELTPLLAPHAATITAAVAYIGSNAAELLPLRRGSTIIVDADITTVRAGATDPNVLLTWARSGVKVYSLKNLHAKLILAEAVDTEHDAFTVAGSANLSASSATRLYESVVLADGECLDEAREALIEWKRKATMLTPAALEQLVDEYATERTPTPPDADDEDGDVEDGESVPWRRPKVLHLTAAEPDIEPSEEAQAHKEKLATEYGCAGDSGYRIDMFWWDDTDRVQYDNGEHVILVEGTKSWKPRSNGSVSEPGELIYTYLDTQAWPQRRYYYLLVQVSECDVRVPDVEALFENLGEKPAFNQKYVRPVFVDALLGLWPDLEYEDA
ncbi:phospholipase D family protein [Prescottella subtropica]|uniref:phospholipase D family protein n=1 Tax=Prescottella subtropica TaxID=2545757 RepID=UPI0010F63907|nr:phospholipase D family protein [Prescottella subtropica]